MVVIGLVQRPPANILILMRFREGHVEVRSVWLCNHIDVIGSIVVPTAIVTHQGLATLLKILWFLLCESPVSNLKVKARFAGIGGKLGLSVIIDAVPDMLKVRLEGGHSGAWRYAPAVCCRQLQVTKSSDG